MRTLGSVVVLKATAVTDMEKHIKNRNSSKMARILPDEFLRRLRMLSNRFSISKIMLYFGVFLNPTYKTCAHLKYLP